MIGNSSATSTRAQLALGESEDSQQHTFEADYQAGSASSPTKPCGSMWIDVDADCGRIASPTTSPTTPCVPHAGLVTQSWYDPYRNAVLPDRLRSIAYKNTTVDCNPASCDNPPQCGIPPSERFAKRIIRKQSTSQEIAAPCMAAGWRQPT